MATADLVRDGGKPVNAAKSIIAIIQIMLRGVLGTRNRRSKNIKAPISMPKCIPDMASRWESPRSRKSRPTNDGRECLSPNSKQV